MVRLQNAIPIFILLSAVAGLGTWAVYSTFIAGTTSGPDFVRELQLGGIAGDSVPSVELVQPAVGHTPFTSGEYDSLPRQATIKAPALVNKFLALLKNCEPGYIYQNHPTMLYEVYLKVNCQDGFYWLLVDVHQDGQGAILYVSANTRNATNPNGASAYHLDNFSEFLAVLQRGESRNRSDAAKGP